MYMLSAVLFIVGLFVLIKGADFLVSGASSFARRFGIPTIVIGLTVVAFGTSAPELSVSALASLEGNSNLAIGNVLGSNIANIFLILGLSALVSPLMVQKNTAWKEIPFALLALIALAFMVLDGTPVTAFEGGLLLLFFSIFLYYTASIAYSQKDSPSESPVVPIPLYQSVLMAVGGLIAVIIGGDMVVDSAILIATSFGISETVIALTIVAVGTSLPELATSVVAAMKKMPDIAVGNIIGSNIFNVFFILGISALINPLTFSPVLVRDIGVAIFATVVLFVCMFIGKKFEIQRWQGGVLLSCYVAYIILLLLTTGNV